MQFRTVALALLASYITAVVAAPLPLQQVRGSSFRSSQHALTCASAALRVRGCFRSVQRGCPGCDLLRVSLHVPFPQHVVLTRCPRANYYPPPSSKYTPPPPSSKYAPPPPSNKYTPPSYGSGSGDKVRKLFSPRLGPSLNPL
jgi:hypothetical protein